MRMVASSQSHKGKMGGILWDRMKWTVISDSGRCSVDETVRPRRVCGCDFQCGRRKVDERSQWALETLNGHHGPWVQSNSNPPSLSPSNDDQITTPPALISLSKSMYSQISQ